MERLLSTFSFTVERLWQHRVLVLWTLMGLSAATTLALSLMLYVDAVNTNILGSRLGTPPYAFRFRYLGSWQGNITLADVDAANASIYQTFTEQIGLPVATSGQFISGGKWNLQRQAETPAPLGVYTLGSLEHDASQIRIVQGEWNDPTERVEDDPIPVLVPMALFYSTGLQVGDHLTTTRSDGKVIQLEVTALWEAVNKNDPSWMLPTTFFDQVLLLHQSDLFAVLDGLATPIEEVDWQIVFDGSSLRTSDVNGLIDQIEVGQRQVANSLPGIRLDLSPQEELKTFSADVSQLTQQLVIVIMPIIGLILYFVTMLAEMLVNRQQQEDVTLTSRGIRRFRLLRLHALMWLILALIALGIGIIVSPLVVQWVGQTVSFLEFSSDTPTLEVAFTQQTLMVGIATGLLAASSGLMIAWRTTGQSITSFKVAQARTGRAWWQRAYLDVLLLIPSGYVYYSLRSKGGLSSDAQNPFNDPLVFIAPTLFSLGLTLLFLRVYPFLLGLAARFLELTSNVAALMALREITRSIGRYQSGLLMMGFTLSLIGFTSSMANTLDQSLEDVINYQVGADSVLLIATDAQTEESAASDGSVTVTVTGYNTLPANMLMDIEGVQAVSRVGRYNAEIVLPTQRLSGTLLGVDRASMPAIARYRADFGDEPIADMLNKLATNRTGMLLSRQTAQEYSLQVGQMLDIRVSILGEFYETEVPIAGFLDYFPTLDPREGFFMVGNLDPLFELVGTELPHDIWLSVDPQADLPTLRQEAQTLGFPILEWVDPQTLIYQARIEPTRRGIFGFLSVGFVSAIGLSLVASIIQSTASFKAQATQIGSLRAMGLGGMSVTAYLLLSQGIAALGGVAGGTAIGITTTLLFLPLLDFSGGLPPYVVNIVWGELLLVYLIFAGVLFFVTLLTTAMLGRQTLSTLVKLGDA